MVTETTGQSEDPRATSHEQAQMTELLARLEELRDSLRRRFAGARTEAERSGILEQATTAVLVALNAEHEDALEHARTLQSERLRSLANAPVLWTTDSEGNAVEDSPSWRAFTGLTYEHWKGRAWLDAIHPDDRQRASEAWSAAVAERIAFKEEFRLRCPDGSYAWTLARAAPVFGRDGLVEQWIGVNIDISERKRIEEEQTRLLRDQREANARMVGATIGAQEATDEAQAARDRAEQNERELRALADFREMFIGIVGHDLRNPLGAIDMAADILRRTGHLDELGTWAVGRIVKSSNRMMRMINQLLDLTRVRLGGGIPLDAKPTDLSEVCQSVVEEFGTPIHLNLEGDLRGTWDADRLAEVLSNIVANAIEHAAQGTTVAVEARADGADVVVEISNQGNPIPADVLPFIFEPFRRARPSERLRAGHLGLGLYVAKEIVRGHGGTLHVHSSGSTTTFAMRLPREMVDRRQNSGR